MQRKPGPFYLLFMLIAFASLFMYGRTRFVGEGLYITGEKHEIFLGSHQGVFDFGICPTPDDESCYGCKVMTSGPFTYVRCDRFVPRSVLAQVYHFNDYDEVAIHIPYPFIFFLAIAMPLLPVMFREVKNRSRTGPFCATCNYSLAGTSSERCPECGAKR